MNKATRELINASKEAAKWMKDATVPNEVNHALRRLQTAIKKAEQSGKANKPSGYLLLLQRGDGLRRITATIETGDKYLSRVGWAALGVEAEVIHATEVLDLEGARDTLKTLLPKERWGGQGMEWSETPKSDLIAAIKNVKAIINNHK